MRSHLRFLLAGLLTLPAAGAAAAVPEESLFVGDMTQLAYTAYGNLPLEDHLQQIEAWRGSIGVDDVKPYPVAQQLGVNKNLTWKASRIM